jgi:hypothetical protein
MLRRNAKELTSVSIPLVEGIVALSISLYHYEPMLRHGVSRLDVQAGIIPYVIRSPLNLFRPSSRKLAQPLDHAPGTYNVGACYMHQPQHLAV